MREGVVMEIKDEKTYVQWLPCPISATGSMVNPVLEPKLPALRVQF